MDSIFLYVEKNGEITITGLQEGTAETAIEIPETIDNMPVTEIAEQAFLESPITAVKIGKNIREIGELAFGVCKKLSSVTWNQKCDVIPSDCFAECSNLTQFDFSNIKRIEVRAFRDSGLTSVTLSKGTAFGQSCFAQCNGLKKIEWLSGQNIEGKIFEGCKNIKEIFISDKVKNIEASAFASSPNVEISFI